MKEDDKGVEEPVIMGNFQTIVQASNPNFRFVMCENMCIQGELTRALILEKKCKVI